MEAFENARNKTIEQQKLRNEYINNLTGIDRMLAKLDQWENEFDIPGMKADTEQFRISLNANRNRIFSQLKKL